MPVLHAQQDPMFTRYAFNSLSFNPAYAGSNDHLAAALIHRKQWIGIKGAPSTQSLTLHSPLQNERIGLGWNMALDKAGPVQVLGADLSYAYRFPLGDAMRLSLGVQAGMVNWSSNRNDLSLENPTDVVFQNNLNRTVPNFGAGIYLSSERFYAGIGCPRLVEYGLYKASADRDGLYGRMYRHYYATIGAAFPLLDEVLVFKPALLVKTTDLFSNLRKDAAFQNVSTPTAIDVETSLFFLQTLWVGVAFRTAVQLNTSSADSFDLWTAWYLRNGLRLGLAFDIPVNGLLSTSPGSLQLLAGYEFDIKVRKVAPPRYF